MAKTVKVTWKDSTTPAVTHSTVYRDDVLIATVPIGTEVYYDETAQEGTTPKYEIQGKTPDGESTEEVLGRNVDVITISQGTSIEFTTSSKSTTWAFNSIVNNGGDIEWSVDGGQVQTVSGSNSPVFNLENSGTVSIIKGTSGSSFSALTELYADNLLVSGVDILSAVDLSALSIKGDYALTNIDLSTLTNLTTLTVRTQNLVALDIANNTSLVKLWAYDNKLSTIDLSNNSLLDLVHLNINSLDTDSLDGIVNTLASFAVSGGELEIDTNSGNLTEDSYAGYTTLKSRNWTIDVAEPPAP